MLDVGGELYRSGRWYEIVPSPYGSMKVYLHHGR